MAVTPTKDTYTEFDRAYDYFNARLYAGKLPPCCRNTWTDARGQIITDEIALNPDKFAERSTAETLSTLVHEMCHLEQHHFGKPSRGRYHNKQWARMMEAVGLIPSDTGQEGGKKTGERVSHYIEPGGRFDRACLALIADGFTVPWHGRTGAGEDPQRKQKRRASKTKYACPSCDLTVWGKPDLPVICGACEKRLEPEVREDKDELSQMAGAAY